MIAADYLLQLQALLPQGAAWARGLQSTLARLLAAWADGYARVDARAEALLAEIDPRTTVELLSDWERVAGLPDPCVTAAGLDQSVTMRQAALFSKLTDQACVSRADFIAMAAKFGYPAATITEFAPFVAGSASGDAIWSEADRFAWQINLPSAGGVFPFTAGSASGTALNTWGDAALECRISQFKHAETDVVFAYA